MSLDHEQAMMELVLIAARDKIRRISPDEIEGVLAALDVSPNELIREYFNNRLKENKDD